MLPTLAPGDRVLAKPYPSDRFPATGDIIAFRGPKDPGQLYVHRVVGLPGDTVQMLDGLLHISGVPVKRERIADFVNAGLKINAKRWLETLPNGVSHETLDLIDGGFYDTTPVYTVPAGHYFVLGDNRDNPSDSRVLTKVGYIPGENVVGRVERWW